MPNPITIPIAEVLMQLIQTNPAAALSLVESRLPAKWAAVAKAHPASTEKLLQAVAGCLEADPAFMQAILNAVS